MVKCLKKQFSGKIKVLGFPMLSSHCAQSTQNQLLGLRASLYLVKKINDLCTKDLLFATYLLRGHSKTTLINFCPVLITYLPVVDIFTL